MKPCHHTISASRTASALSRVAYPVISSVTTVTLASIPKRLLAHLTMCISALLAFMLVNVATGEPLHVGAVRWDAWYGPLDARGTNAQETLDPSQWHNRIPFFGVEESSSSATYILDTQAEMDQEITYAKNAGLDYWAYLYANPDNNPVHIALHLHRSSSIKTDMNYSIIISGTDSNPTTWPAMRGWLVTYMQDSYYLKILGGRPFIFLWNPGGMAANFGSWSAAKTAVDQLRTDAQAAGLLNPYVVILGSASELDNLGGQALSTYAYTGGTTGSGTPFSGMLTAQQNDWNSKLATGKKVVPTVSAGWDGRPRVLQPYPWDPQNPASSFYNNYYQTPTPDQIVQGLEDAIMWNIANPTTAEPNAVLIFAWNEIDEGGWLVPTLYNGTDRLDAISALLNFTLTNLAPSATLSVDSTNGTYTKDKGVDGIKNSSTSRWISTNTAEPHWFQLDWATSKTISSAKVWSGASTGPGWQINSYKMQYWDGSAWVDISGASVTNNTQDGYAGQFNNLSFTAVTTNKVRMYITDGTTQAGYTDARLLEIEVWGN